MSLRHGSRGRSRPRLLTCAVTAGTLVLSGLVTVAQATPQDSAAWGGRADLEAQRESLDRGLVSVRTGDGNLVSWRWLASDPDQVAFHVYRDGAKVTSQPITDSTNFLDRGAAASASYRVRAVVGGVESPPSSAALQLRTGYHDVPLQQPPGSGFTYQANDASVGDLDGDGTLEFVLKWDPDNSKDNSQAGVTGNTLLDAYTLSGDRLWRIDLGRNIRSGAHYTQFQVYDYDGDGRSEVALKTADGTVDGTGEVIGDATADHRNTAGYVLSGPEFLTVFDGRSGAALDTVDYDPPRGQVSAWGDSYGNRVDRFLAGTAYLDGRRPSLVMARGYYTRAVVAAWDFRDGELTKRWTFDSDAAGNGAAHGQGNHQLSVADVDGDGRQEIVYGSATIDDNGSLMYATGFGHGDALHVGDFAPQRAGLEVFTPHESSSQPGADLHDAGTGRILWRAPDNGGAEGPGRAVAADVYPGNAGAELWLGLGSNVSDLHDTTGDVIGPVPSSTNFLSWWDGDTSRELLDGIHIDAYRPTGDVRMLTGSGVSANNGTKANPALSGDLLGDWREEVVWRTSDNSALRIYSTPHPTRTRITTLLHDLQYRTALAWQNTAYNQPPQPSFPIGDGMPPAPRPLAPRAKTG